MFILFRRDLSLGTVRFVSILFVCTISDMKIDFDPGKDAINTRKHGVSLADAALLECNDHGQAHVKQSWTGTA